MAGRIPAGQRPGHRKPAPKPKLPPRPVGTPKPRPAQKAGLHWPDPYPRAGLPGLVPERVALVCILLSACATTALPVPGAPTILPSSRAVLLQDGAELTAWHVIDLWLPLGESGVGLPLTVEIIVDSGQAEWRCQVSAPWLVVPIEVRLPMSGGAAPGPAGTARLE